MACVKKLTEYGAGHVESLLKQIVPEGWTWKMNRTSEEHQQRACTVLNLADPSKQLLSQF